MVMLHSSPSQPVRDNQTQGERKKGGQEHAERLDKSISDKRKHRKGVIKATKKGESAKSNYPAYAIAAMQRAVKMSKWH